MVNTDRKIWYLQNVALFQGIDKQFLAHMAEKMSERVCKRRDQIYTPYESTKSLYIVKKGEVTLYSSDQGRKIIIDVLKPGAVFGNFTFRETSNTHFAEVTEDTALYVFSVDDFKAIVRDKPEIALNLIEIISQRLTDCENRIKGNLYAAKDKVLHYLRILDEKAERSMLSRLFKRKKRITHEELSHHSGLSRETVTRAINDLKKEGQVSLSASGRICLKDGTCL